MKLIAGLGNPGEKYKGTRHNAGFFVLDKLKTRIIKLQNPNSKFQYQKKFQCEVLNSGNILLAKPQTFMNQSGDAVSKLVNFFKIYLSDLYVMHDDLDIGLGKYKIQLGKGPKIHNGLNSIYEKLGSKDFWHVRVGIDNRKAGDRTISGERFVLQKFSSEEHEILSAVLDSVVEELVSLF